MPKTYKFDKSNIAEIEKAIKIVKDKKIYKRLEILKLRVNKKSNMEISEITGCHYTYISQIVSKYFSQGISAITNDRRTGNNRKLTVEEEKEFLEPFLKSAENGNILIVNDIRLAFDQKTGEKSSYATIYRLLHRNGWRKIMPRSKHPNKASDEAIAAYKKNH